MAMNLRPSFITSWDREMKGNPTQPEPGDETVNKGLTGMRSFARISATKRKASCDYSA